MLATVRMLVVRPRDVWVISYRANMIKNDATVWELIMLVSNLSKKVLG